MNRYIFAGIFLFSFILQAIAWNTIHYYDSGIWSYQAYYVESGDPWQFDAARAYGHPGGPIIEGTIAFHHLFGLSYMNALNTFMAFMISLAIACICTLLFYLKKGSLWWIAVLGGLSLNRLYIFATPPSAVVAVLCVLLCIVSLYMYEKKSISSIAPWWGLLSGIAIATRFDIGGFMAVGWMIYLLPRLRARDIAIMIGISSLAFCAFDPFMWFMPIRHIGDLFGKIVYHYAEYAPTHLSVIQILNVSYIAFASIIMAIVYLFTSKKIPVILPKRFIVVMLAITAMLYAVFLSSHYQAERYFIPIIFIWEALLPLFIPLAVSKISLRLPKHMDNPKKAERLIEAFLLIVILECQIIPLFFI